MNCRFHILLLVLQPSPVPKCPHVPGIIVLVTRLSQSNVISSLSLVYLHIFLVSTIFIVKTVSAIKVKNCLSFSHLLCLLLLFKLFILMCGPHLFILLIVTNTMSFLWITSHTTYCFTHSNVNLMLPLFFLVSKLSLKTSLKGKLSHFTLTMGKNTWVLPNPMVLPHTYPHMESRTSPHPRTRQNITVSQNVDIVILLKLVFLFYLKLPYH